MASASTSNQSIDSNNASLSHFQKTVCLQDWWFIKVETDVGEKRLAIAGFTSGEQQARRVFSSAPIHRRFDVFTLETVDGIFIITKGFINKVRTEENGFPAEVFNHFVFGFPPYWEEYAEKCFGGGFTNEAVSRSNLSHDKLSTHSGAVAGTKDYSEATPKKNEKLIGEESHGSDKMGVGLEDSGIILSAMEQHSLRDGSWNIVSFEITKACPSQVVPKIIIGDALKSSDLHNNVTDFLSCVEDETIFDIGSSSSIGVKGTIGSCSLTSKDEGQDDRLKSAVANVGIESGGKSILNVFNAGFQEPTDDITVSNLDAGCIKDGSVMICGFLILILIQNGNKIMETLCFRMVWRAKTQKSLSSPPLGLMAQSVKMLTRKRAMLKKQMHLGRRLKGNLHMLWLVDARDFLSSASLFRKGELFSWSRVPEFLSCFRLLRVGRVLKAGWLLISLALFRAASPPAAIDYGSWFLVAGHFYEDGYPSALRVSYVFYSWWCFVSDDAFLTGALPAFGQFPWFGDCVSVRAPQFSRRFLWCLFSILLMRVGAGHHMNIVKPFCFVRSGLCRVFPYLFVLLVLYCRGVLQLCTALLCVRKGCNKLIAGLRSVALPSRSYATISFWSSLFSLRGCCCNMSIIIMGPMVFSIFNMIWATLSSATNPSLISAVSPATSIELPLSKKDGTAMKARRREGWEWQREWISIPFRRPIDPGFTILALRSTHRHLHLQSTTHKPSIPPMVP
ncbi:uncharacterized protein LOC132314671 [Cornus florida]|uniref:uncharacterized protein LOC132314671 n=1 Tax=Cornus florida TaxID=4283 RepID=UPI0028A01A7D|nr:uncharacterized protein LOC132314671 [Cornus florida]